MFYLAIIYSDNELYLKINYDGQNKAFPSLRFTRFLIL